MARKPNRFHGRIPQEDGRCCDQDGCRDTGEFRAPKSASPEIDGYYWFCLEHVRAFNANWNFFNTATPEQVARMAHGHAQWDRPTWPFGMNPNGHGARTTLHDPLGIFKGAKGFDQFTAVMHPVTGKPLTRKDRDALSTLGLDERASSTDIRHAYRQMLKRYHPDHHGGDKSKEKKLRLVIEACKHLLKDVKTDRQR